MRHSTSDYTPDWPQVAQRVKNDAGWKCVRCGHIHEKRHVLTVHHLDMNPSNNAWWNIPALCQVCHLHIQAKVFMEQPYLFEHSDWFKPYVAGYYAHLLTLPEDREYIAENADRVITLWNDTQGQAPFTQAPGARNG